MTDIATVEVPSDLDFDSTKFPTYRHSQLETAREVATSDKPLFLVEAPTGSGKSLLALTSHRLLGLPRGAYVVSTKQLQDQLVADFDLPVLKGRSNYPCLHFPNLFPDVTAEICKEYLGGDECSYARACPYLTDKRKALSAPLCVLNYPLLLAEANFVGGFSDLGYLILDEVDTVEDHLMSFVEVNITQALMKRLGLGSPRYVTKVGSWREWLTRAISKVEEELTKMGPPEGGSPQKVRSFVRMKRVLSKLKFLGNELDDGWVMEKEEKDGEIISMTFKPIRVSKYAGHNLWRHTNKALGMSATIMGAPALALELGLHSWDVASVNLPSPFAVENRRVEYIPVASVTYKTKGEAYPKVVDAIDRILARHPNEKVLIHAVSYELRNYMIDHLKRGGHKLMSHDRLDRVTALENFKASTVPIAFISPSMERGVDLPGDLCRVVIVAKVPYPSLGSPQVSRRLYGSTDGSLWYARRTARSLVQMTGRATRSEDDWSVSYILDEQFGQLVARHQEIFPDWWRDAVRSGSL